MLPLAAPCRPLPDTLRLHSVIDMVVTTLDIRDPYTFEHSYRVAGLAEMLAQAMHLSPEQCHLVHYAAHLHDIGKIGFSDKVLNKPGKLTAEEMAELQSHSLLGHAILGKIPELAGLAHIVRHHHERWDGAGYPDGLSGQDIPLESRIIGLVDAFDAMTSNRPYRHRMSHFWALEEIGKHAGSQFCPNCAEVFLAHRAKVKMSQYQGRITAFAHHLDQVRHDSLMHSRRLAHP